MRNLYMVCVAFFWVATASFAQVGINIDNSAPDGSAMLDVQSTERGFLLPRMTRAQRNAIASPAEGLMVYCLNCGASGTLSIFTNGAWLTFSPCFTASPGAGTPVLSPGQVVWNWLAASGDAGYKWNTTTDYETATDMGTSLTKTETGTACGTTYARYVWAYSSCGESSMIMLTTTVPSAAPDEPAVGTHTASQTSVTWNWLPVAGATGYRWNTVNDFATAIDKGAGTTHAETGLACATAYTRYVWAYNGCGSSTPLTMNQSTYSCFLCGTTFLTISHVSTGGVAPVNKTTTYGTVTNIPGETAKCWITSNLGSTQQATSVSDSTEASAGWYWQFNHKKGYKHDGSTVTPAWPITVIYENSDWLIANDPCNLELGTYWRLPTYTEWYNVDNTGGWTNWNGPWGSGLKLHAAGHIWSDGVLSHRGTSGHYWSSAQYGISNGSELYFRDFTSEMYHNDKAFGLSVRCLRD